MGLTTGKPSVITGIPNFGGKSEDWIQWHKDLSSNFGTEIANGLWLKAWRIRGNNGANTNELRTFMEENGVKISESSWDSIVDVGVGLMDSLDSMFTAGKYVGTVLVILILLSVGTIVYKIVKNPAVAVGTAGRVILTKRL